MLISKKSGQTQDLSASVNKTFDEGLVAIAQAVVEATDKDATSIIGGGGSVAAINQAGIP